MKPGRKTLSRLACRAPYVLARSDWSKRAAGYGATGGTSASAAKWGNDGLARTSKSRRRRRAPVAHASLAGAIRLVGDRHDARRACRGWGARFLSEVARNGRPRNPCTRGCRSTISRYSSVTRPVSRKWPRQLGATSGQSSSLWRKEPSAPAMLRSGLFRFGYWPRFVETESRKRKNDDS